MMNIQTNIDILSNIIEDEAVINAVQEYINANQKVVFKCAQMLIDGKWAKLMKKSNILKLCALTMSLEQALDRYHNKGVSERIFYDTMSDIRIWVADCMDRYGEIGLYELNWLRLHINLEIFRLGRLQYQMLRYPFVQGYSGEGGKLALGSKCLSVHIPRGAKLDNKACRQSMALAQSFFKRYYSDFATRLCGCFSWLLYPDNKQFMEPDSNIMKFASMFDIVFDKECPHDAILFLFGDKIDDKKWIKSRKKYGHYIGIDSLKVKTSLHQRAVDYMRHGGQVGVALGVIDFDKWAEVAEDESK